MTSSRSVRITARLLWLVPAFLFAISVHQVWTAYGLQKTIRKGIPAVAEVTKLHQENRVDVTYDYMNLRVRLPDGEVLTKKKMSIPHTIAPLLEDQRMLAVYVLPGARQEVVIREGPGENNAPGRELGRTQRRIAVVNAAMSGFAALFFAIGVFWWNRYLKRRGDPAEEEAGQDEEAYSASQTAR